MLLLILLVVDDCVPGVDLVSNRWGFALHVEATVLCCSKIGSTWTGMLFLVVNVCVL